MLFKNFFAKDPAQFKKMTIPQLEKEDRHAQRLRGLADSGVFFWGGMAVTAATLGVFSAGAIGLGLLATPLGLIATFAIGVAAAYLTMEAGINFDVSASIDGGETHRNIENILYRRRHPVPRKAKEAKSAGVEAQAASRDFNGKAPRAAAEDMPAPESPLHKARIFAL